MYLYPADELPLCDSADEEFENDVEAVCFVLLAWWDVLDTLETAITYDILRTCRYKKKMIEDRPLSEMLF